MADLLISPKYAKFFLKNLNTRHVLLQGSRRSAKSYSIFKFIALRSLGTTPLHTIICTASFPATTLAIADWQDATGFIVAGSAVLGMHVKFPNGSLVQFRSFDTPTKAQGSHCDIAVIEEALNIPENILSVFLLGVRKQAYFVYNPTRAGVLDHYILEDKSNYLKTTFKDNPFLGPEQLEEFEKIRQRAESPTASIIDIYNKRVYYDGEFTDMSGKVFTMVYTCEDEAYDKLPAVETVGLDFGFRDSKDASCAVGAKIHDGCLYLKQYVNSTHLTNNKELAFALADCGFNCYTYMCGDYGGLGKSKIEALASAGNYEWQEEQICRGFNIVSVKKGRIVDGLNTMLQYNKIIVTASSKDLRAEMDRYELGPEGTEVSKHQNLVDAARYATLMQKQIFV